MRTRRMKFARWAGIPAVILALAAAPLSAEAATAAPPEDGSRPGLVPDSAPLPEGLELGPAANESDFSPIPDDVHDALWDLTVGSSNFDINAFEWVADTATLIVYSVEAESVTAELAQAVPDQRIDAVEAVHSKAEVDQVLQTITGDGGRLPNGDRIVMAKPARDGASITLSVEPGLTKRGLDVKRIQSEVESTIPLEVEVAPEVEQAARNLGFYATMFSGAYMQNGTSSCTTGFRISNLSTNAPLMLSADHCSRGNIGSNWYYSSASSSSSLIGPYGGMLGGGAAGGVDTGVWTGASKLYPYMLTGEDGDTSTYAAIRGGTVPVLGDVVCYSGSLSGRVCSNEVIYTGMLTCYSVTMCYSDQTITHQNQNTAAVGNGDSGGPVYGASVYGALAAGIISGMVGGSSTCTGDPGGNGRNCSPVVIMAPLNNAIGTTGYGLNYVP